MLYIYQFCQNFARISFNKFQKTQSYQGLWAIFWASMRRYPNFFGINSLSIKVSNQESDGWYGVSSVAVYLCKTQEEFIIFFKNQIFLLLNDHILHHLLDIHRKQILFQATPTGRLEENFYIQKLFLNLAVLIKFAFMSLELFLLCKSHFLQKQFCFQLFIVFLIYQLKIIF